MESNSSPGMPSTTANSFAPRLAMRPMRRGSGPRKTPLSLASWGTVASRRVSTPALLPASRPLRSQRVARQVVVIIVPSPISSSAFSEEALEVYDDPAPPRASLPDAPRPTHPSSQFHFLYAPDIWENFR